MSRSSCRFANSCWPLFFEGNADFVFAPVSAFIVDGAEAVALVEVVVCVVALAADCSVVSTFFDPGTDKGVLPRRTT